MLTKLLSCAAVVAAAAPALDDAAAAVVSVEEQVELHFVLACLLLFCSGTKLAPF